MRRKRERPESGPAGPCGRERRAGQDWVGEAHAADLVHRNRIGDGDSSNPRPAHRRSPPLRPPRHRWPPPRWRPLARSSIVWRTTPPPPSSSAWGALDVAVASFRGHLPRNLSLDAYYAALLPLPTAAPASITEIDPSAASSPSSTNGDRDRPFCSIRPFIDEGDRDPTPPALKNLCFSTAPLSAATATPTPPLPPTSLSPRRILFVIDLLNGLVLTKDEELMFRKAFNEKFPHFKVGDIINHLENEKFTVEEYSFLLRIIYSKLGQNKELADLLTQEDINLSSSNDEIDKDPMMARIEAKVDLLNKKGRNEARIPQETHYYFYRTVGCMECITYTCPKHW
ncbi:uncharacterized protein [Miscanthus floridulus]|uniref:uncharacterized protein n=1 Tax=Miscanthus floridulus TaxID=154761 RepID=UPI0034596EF6